MRREVQGVKALPVFILVRFRGRQRVYDGRLGNAKVAEGAESMRRIPVAPVWPPSTLALKCRRVCRP